MQPWVKVRIALLGNTYFYGWAERAFPRGSSFLRLPFSATYEDVAMALGLAFSYDDARRKDWRGQVPGGVSNFRAYPTGEVGVYKQTCEFYSFR